MSLVYVTGISGSGKSAARKELRRCGYSAFGTDEDSIAYFYNNATGETVGNELTSEDRTPEWRARHEWKAARSKVEKLAESAKDRPVFLCGVVANQYELWDLFSKVFALIVDDETLKRRLADRIDNDFGKSPHELKEILEWQGTVEQDYEKLGAVIINAAQPIENVVDEIIHAVGEAES